MRPSATSLWGLQLLVYEAFSYYWLRRVCAIYIHTHIRIHTCYIHIYLLYTYTYLLCTAPSSMCYSAEPQQVCIYVCVYACMYIRVYLFICIHTYIHIQGIHTDIYIYKLHIYIYIYIFIFIYIYIYIYIALYKALDCPAIEAQGGFFHHTFRYAWSADTAGGSLNTGTRHTRTYADVCRRMLTPTLPAAPSTQVRGLQLLVYEAFSY